MLFISGPASEDFYKTILAIHLILAWVGAGRCLGFDYYFFKRRRGFWW
jgi:thiosulfate dehydrogenase [quinone] large subunit